MLKQRQLTWHSLHADLWFHSIILSLQSARHLSPTDIVHDKLSKRIVNSINNIL